MRKLARPVFWLTVFTAVATVCAVLLLTALRSPVNGAVSHYSATFTDVSGLDVGNDVRISGVQVGKVEQITLEGRTARVQFSALNEHPLYRNTIAAVRYQNLLGQRYVELVQTSSSAERAGQRLPNGAAIPVGQTVPSFDITKLFNGFRPVFQTLDAAQLNQFGENLLRLIQGDDTGIGPVLRDLDAISKYAVNRQAVITLLLHNLSDLSHDLGGKSQQLFELINALNGALATFTSKAEQFRTSIDIELPMLRSLVRVLQTAERGFDGSTSPLYGLATRLFPQTPTVIAGLSLTPTLIQGLRDSLVDDERPAFACSNGEVRLPGIGEVSFAQQDLVVCR
ncbi:MULTISPECIES: MlaD family protein [unclassified Mycobacterium]|uniref:MlaD family protein n=1 Tax=unclassified Mycobacterium TaxID=2642494 RepID=UPI000FBB428D|nr:MULTISPECIES: MCE family protein [unclassified Mycobacterium]MDP7706573.1 MCE family protein [Mycobacterium sp. TY815]MDP7725641.1 MCE family protein [Mycobacterium sp. TY814]RUP04664.1 MAG: MCE family protein [Mycobacterium sp.]